MFPLRGSAKTEEKGAVMHMISRCIFLGSSGVTELVCLPFENDGAEMLYTQC